MFKIESRLGNATRLVIDTNKRIMML